MLRDGLLGEIFTRTDAARGRACDFAGARGGKPPALSRRIVQYSQVRLVAVGNAVSLLASSVSPGVKVVTSPRSFALS